MRELVEEETNRDTKVEAGGRKEVLLPEYFEGDIGTCQTNVHIRQRHTLLTTSWKRLNKTDHVRLHIQASHISMI